MVLEMQIIIIEIFSIYVFLYLAHSHDITAKHFSLPHHNPNMEERFCFLS